MTSTTVSDPSATIRVAPEALTAAAAHVRLASSELDGAQAEAGRLLTGAGGTLDPASRAALSELVQAWGLLGAQLAATSGALATSLADSAARYHAAEQALGAAFGLARP